MFRTLPPYQNTSKDHITPILHELHWLPVKDRIAYKILLLTYKALHGKALIYLADLLHPHTPPQPLRSGDAGLLLAPPPTRIRWGGRSFSCAAPRLWNSPPRSTRKSSPNYF
ncbi:hypothetical protein LDENG_00024350 [Lucifuga dentata]|nr:hypothetical protein LDENG_00024350 [Lucifuga dentata]